MARLAEDRFRIFVSHKHEDHALAVAVQQALEGISPKIECFVSGVSIAAGADWNREIRSSLAQSHLLILLFTRPTATWDWCLFETGLFTRSDADEVSAVVCLFDPRRDHAEPAGQPAGHPGAPRRRGALPRRPLPSDVAGIGRLAPRRPRPPGPPGPAGGRGGSGSSTPSRSRPPPTPRTTHATASCSTCAPSTPSTAASPRPPRSSSGPARRPTSPSAMFNLAEMSSDVTWGQLVDAVDGRTAAWRTQLDRRFVAALNKELFTPITGTFRAWSQGRRRQRILKPILYRIVWIVRPVPWARTSSAAVAGRPR